MSEQEQKIWREREVEHYGDHASYLWHLHYRDDQIPPLHDEWVTWLLLGGRGAGKTRAGAEWIRELAEDPHLRIPPRIALVAETYADAREVMIEGPSGLRAISLDNERPAFEASRRRLVWPKGAVAYCFSAEDPDGLRGYQFDAAWSDELCKWRYPEETWSNLQLALRLGERPQQVVTTTPRPLALLKRLMNAKTTVMSRASTYKNRNNLAEAFFSEIASTYEGTSLGRQELMGEIVEDVAGALWSWDMIEAARSSLAPTLDRIVVAIDPPVSIGADADECGIIVAGVSDNGDERTAYILADWSEQGLSPRGWGQKAIAAYHEYKADRLVIEVNQGGEMARHVLVQIDANVAVKTVHATRGKRLRAEPVAALYEAGRVRHVGAFSKLEDQMTNYTGLKTGSGGSKASGSASASSPDRLDALVWALTDLMLTPTAPKPGVHSL